MKTQYFTFGQNHTHEVNNMTLDHDIVVKITAENPRQRMTEMFGNKWSMQYDSFDEVRIQYYPRGVVDLS